MSKPIQIFIAYAREDAGYCTELRKHLKPLERVKYVNICYDGQITAGEEWEKSLLQKLRNANIVLLLISADFIDSEFCYETLYPEAIKLNKAGKARVIPVIIRECDWKTTPLGKMKPLAVNGFPPAAGKKIWPTPDYFYTSVVSSIKELVCEELEKRDLLKQAICEPDTPLETPKPKSAYQQGRVFYLIPQEMQLHQPHKCYIRIAPEEVREEVLRENLKNAENAVIENIKIGSIMKAELAETGNQKAFDIECLSELEQPIEEDNYTEWQYEVTPLREGKHNLHLKIAALVTVKTESKTRETYKSLVTLTRNIEVNTTYAPQPKQYEPADILLLKSIDGISDEQTKATLLTQFMQMAMGKMRSVGAMALLLVLFLPTLTWAIVPQVVMPLYLNIAYDEHRTEKDGRIAVKKDGKWGFVNAWGRESVEPQFDEVKDFENRHVEVRQGDKWGVVAQEAPRSVLQKVWQPTDYTAAPVVLDTIIAIKTDYVTAQIQTTEIDLPLLQAPSQLPTQQTQQKLIQQLPPEQAKALQTADSLLQNGQINTANTLLKTLQKSKPDNPTLQQAIENTAALRQQKQTEQLYEQLPTAKPQQIKDNSQQIYQIRAIKVGAVKKRESYNEPPPTSDEQNKGTSQTPQKETWGSDDNIDDNSTSNPAANNKNTTPHTINPTKPDSTDQKTNTETTTTTTTTPAPQPPNSNAKPDSTDQKTNTETTTTQATETPLPPKPVQGTTPPPSGGQGQDTDPFAAQMVLVQGGTYTMGCTSEQGGDCENDEKPARAVTVSTFSISKYEVTQAQWEAIMGSNPSNNSGCAQCPVEQVSYDDIQKFLQKLNAQTGKNYRLPTEAEWEYAARGGNKTRGYKYAGGNNINGVAWYDDNSDSKTHAVGGKAANELGLYDMSGNVWEWCSDWYKGYPGSSGVSDYTGSSRVLRGGSWSDIAAILSRC